MEDIETYIHQRNVDYLERLADVLDDATRFGEMYDDPEGARYITLSDTVTIQIVARLREIIKEI